MKAKTILISTVVSAALIGGSVYGAYYFARSQKKPVEVVPLANVNYASMGWGYSDSASSMTGEIISRDSQNITLNSEYTLKEVFVEEGDSVKKGDKLLEYDMTLDELKREMEDLTRQTLEITLDSEERQLEKMKNGSYSESSSSSAGLDTSLDGDLTGAADTEEEMLIQDEEVILPDETDPPAETDPSAGSDPEVSDDTEQEEILPDDGEGSLIVDDDTDDVIDTPDTETPQTEAPTNVSTAAFANYVDAEIKGAGGSPTMASLETALSLWEKIATRTDEAVSGPDLFGESGRTIPTYMLNASATAGLSEEEISSLYGRYALVSAQLVKAYLKSIVPEGTTAANMTDDQIAANEQMIRSLVDSWYRYKAVLDRTGVYGISQLINENNPDYFLLSSENDEIAQLIAHYNMLHIITPETETEEETTEFDDDFGDYGGDFGSSDGGGSGYTAAELQAMIKQQESDIEETKLQIRESELRLKQYDRKLSGKIVKATMDGVVRAAGSLDAGTAEGDAFIVIAGKSGMYVKGLISELSLDSVSIGDTVSGTSYDTGINFSAEVTEIEVYPQDNSDYYSYGYGSENRNASYYPFYAYIEDADGLSEGQVEMSLNTSQSNAAISLEAYFIRTDESNHEYVYIQGTDGKLKKQFVKTHTSSDGYSIAIDSGLSVNDKIAFPYGKNVIEGAETIEVEQLSAGEYY